MTLNINSYRILEGTIKDKEGKPIALIRSTPLRGDGETPGWIATAAPGTEKDPIVGYNDQGGPIYSDEYQESYKQGTKDFMQAIIKEQKRLTKANGGDPSVVNIIGAEKDTEDNNEK